MHTTNYFNTFIEVSPETKAVRCTEPGVKKNPGTIARLQFEMISNQPYIFTSDDVLLQVYAVRAGLNKSEWDAERKNFFSKGRPCLRTLPLTKTYGFGIHCNKEGKVALFGCGTAGYRQLITDESVKKLRALR